ncbi:MFS transporter [Ralstonia mannitolilytica]|jgi:D-galactonate transporter|uniref:Inner membrane transport protein RhmT n=1 Tax=Ralstonia mannitolilytica TaxID=105219 RepID=A0AAJ4ZQA3_9RALS|nr:MFS transporter [Ralstonia mannitolilytica]CAG2132915.1 Putative metabolite transport protein NicT [Ralstonia mannitolilytica]CAJ0727347.1 Putative metabolite transport protein NicT [Ralstonia mannitolilytica]SUE25271.1 Inner membrane transport protein RhmT [Ralstonia mannitolilytica]SUE26021.1 Inner membrane transport protein RhmT [Ralstonia mannitolilytica]SUE35831.1 Inner membrane transport protein RhmT [Ralstonia mannitolilytica]
MTTKFASPLPGDEMARADAATFESRTYAKVARRLIPFLMICYLGAYLDRVNVGFAKLQMLNDLRFSETVYGLGAGIFFLGYFLFEVPSNVILHKVGARNWLARIMLTWAVISAGFAFVTTPTSFYVLRFLLGVAEAGFAPGVILYMTYWFPSQRRAKALSMFFMAIPLAGIVGGPLSGYIMHAFHGAADLAGWKWLFLIEALPSLVLGIAILFYLDNGIAQAKWLTDAEKALLERNVAGDNAQKTAHGSVGAFIADRRLWLLAAIYFCVVLGQYGLTFWLPTLIRKAGVADPLWVGVFTAVPYVCAIVALPLIGMSADRRRERRLHLAVPMLVAAAGFALLPLLGNVGASLVCLSIAAAGILSSSSQFWSLPTAMLGGMSAAAGIAAVNCFANLAGFFSPAIVGWLNDLTGKSTAGLIFISSAIVLGAVLVFFVPARAVNR